MQPKYTVSRLRAHLADLEKRQEKKFKQGRVKTIRATRERIDVLIAHQATHGDEQRPAVSQAQAPIDISAGNPNVRESSFAKQAKANGWTVTRRGWPDFMCWRGDDIVLVEVKPDRYGLDPHQVIVMGKLLGLGLKCFKWTPNEGFTRLTKDNLTGGRAKRRTANAMRVLGIA